MKYCRFISISFLVLLSFVLVHSYDAVPGMEPKAIGSAAQLPSGNAGFRALKKDKQDADVLLRSGTGSRLSLNRNNFNPAGAGQFRERHGSYFLHLLRHHIHLFVHRAAIASSSATNFWFTPVVVKLLYPKHWFW